MAKREHIIAFRVTDKEKLQIEDKAANKSFSINVTIEKHTNILSSLSNLTFIHLASSSNIFLLHNHHKFYSVYFRFQIKYITTPTGYVIE